MTTTKTPGKLLLASTSRYRKALLDRLGLEYDTAPHRCDEDQFKTGDLTPLQLAQVLSRAKAESLAEEFPHAWILGSDQVAALGDEILSKPGTEENAVAQLMKMQGRTHELITAMSLRCPDGRVLDAVSVHRLKLRELSRDAIQRYVKLDMPLDCCGSYKIEGAGIALFESIEGTDHTAIMGLSLMSLVTLLRDEGWTLP